MLVSTTIDWAETAAISRASFMPRASVGLRRVPELIMLSRKVEQVHAGRPACPPGLRTCSKLEVHVRKEELILFPAMRRQGSGLLDGPIAQMRHFWGLASRSFTKLNLQQVYQPVNIIAIASQLQVIHAGQKEVR